MPKAATLLLSLLLISAASASAQEDASSEQQDSDLSVEELDDLLLGETMDLPPAVEEEEEEATANDPLPGDLAEAEQALEEMMQELSDWQHDITLAGGVGYKENVLLSAFNRQDSPFLRGEFETFIFRTPLPDRTYYQLYILAEQTQYADVEDLANERFILLQGQVAQPLSSQTKVGLTALYLYLDQVFDISFDELTIDTAVIEEHEVELSPFVEEEINEDWSALMELPVRGAFFRDAANNYIQAGAKFTIEREYGNKSEARATLYYGRRLYGDRELRGLDGFRIAGTNRAYSRSEADLRLRHHWDEQRSWRTTTRLRFRRNEDNGDGYDDWDKVSFSQKLAYIADKWELSVEGKAQFTGYKRQPVSFTDSDLRDRWTYEIGLRYERDLTENLRGYAAYRYEDTDSQRVDEQYDTMRTEFGVGWTF